MMELDQTHTAFPALSYFPESSPEQSWVASVGSLLDGAALLLSASDFSTEEHVSDEIKGPMMALAYGLPTLVTIGRSAGLPIERPVLLTLLSPGRRAGPGHLTAPGRVHRGAGPAPSACCPSPRPNGSGAGDGSPGCARATTKRSGVWPV